MKRSFVFATLTALLFATSLPAATFNILDFGATADDESDDTAAIAKALAACGQEGGGIVYVPAGSFTVTRQGSESPILILPSDTILCGEGPASTLRFPKRASESNFWRMLGHGPEGVRNLTIRDLRLDGGNTHPAYAKGVPEQNHGIFLYAKQAIVENVTIERLLIENFSGDCIALSYGCRNITIRDVAMRNFLRQGVQMGGGNGARDYLVTGCHDLQHSITPGGSTIHVEHARGLKNVQIIANRCRRSILAGGVDGLLICDNVVTGRIEGNGNTNSIVARNIVRGKPESTRALMQFGYANGLLVRDNILRMTPDSAQAGLYIWGKSRYNAHPSRDVSVSGNLISAGNTGVRLNGVDGATIGPNRISVPDGKKTVVISRGENVIVEDSNVPPDPVESKP
ncbi:Poly(beta-D-mannuronate) C5 epimerase 1 [Stieleria neptunia]|uniref:Poly(Beta-D-mannuronate) C5 epimerase 1 n=1 Tax=Stieleria neptunia TaxID=2527979 RepID=A0A518HWT4_9BACT|nr:glycosyl hydrolase family 28-related protein [Stieleria neptunia]QDV45319.1 Poly(beta-D-mannuronate) C5 epimerase 1 [Stieleria neptunia]